MAANRPEPHAQQRARHDEDQPVNGESGDFKPVLEICSVAQRQADQRNDGRYPAADQEPAQSVVQQAPSVDSESDAEEGDTYCDIAQVFQGNEYAVRVVLRQQREPGGFTFQQTGLKDGELDQIVRKQDGRSDYGEREAHQAEVPPCLRRRLWTHVTSATKSAATRDAGYIHR